MLFSDFLLWSSVEFADVIMRHRLHAAAFMPHTVLLLFLRCALVLLSFQNSAATSIVVQGELEKPQPEEIAASVFGYSSSGIISAAFNFPKLEEEGSENLSIFLSVCEVSAIFVRDFAYQRRQLRIGRSVSETCRYSELSAEDFTILPVIWLYKNGKVEAELDSIEIPLQKLDPPVELPNLFVLGLHSFSSNTRISYNVALKLTNPSTRYPHLGFEEAQFPILAATVMSILLLIALALILTVPLVIFTLRRSIPNALSIVLIGAILKGLFAALTFLYFYRVAESGVRPAWYLYTRVIVASTADVSLVIAITSFACGIFVFPSQWLVDDRSPSMFVYIVVTLQLVVFISVKTMFPYNVLGMSYYSFFSQSRTSGSRGLHLFFPSSNQRLAD